MKKTNKSETPRASSGQVHPFGDRVLIKPFTEDELKGKKNNFGIILPDSVSKEKSAQGRVVAVGEVKNVKVGDKIIFSKYSYDEVEYGDEEFYLIKEENILAIIK